MANEIRLVILVLGLIFIGWILWDGLRRRPHHQGGTANGDDSKENEQDSDLSSSNSGVDTATQSDNPVQISDLPEFKAPSQELETQHQQPHADQSQTSTTVFTQASQPPKIIIFHLIAHGKRVFGGFSLLQVLLEQGFYYGDMGIFHYYQKYHEQGKKLFSLAAATPTGDFPISDMASFQCNGLILFMYPEEHMHPATVFDEMVTAAEKLAKSLQADLKIGRDKLEWNEDNLAYWYQQLV